MRVQPDSPRHTDEHRSYFPDWTPHLPKVRQELEADHNSYLAGGYAEEFGYLARPGVSRGVPVLDGEPPEDCAEWRCEAAAMHPGYPITPYPLAVDRDRARSELAAIVESAVTESSATARGSFVTVMNRPYQLEHHRSARRIAAAVTRLLAVLVALRWDWPRRRVIIRE